EGLTLALAESGLALFFEDERDINPGAPLDLGVAVVEGHPKQARQKPPDGGLAGAHGADEEQVWLAEHGRGDSIPSWDRARKKRPPGGRPLTPTQKPVDQGLTVTGIEPKVVVPRGAVTLRVRLPLTAELPAARVAAVKFTVYSCPPTPASQGTLF